MPSISVPDSSNVYHSFVDTSDATASASELLVGTTAYVNGVKLSGMLPSYSAGDGIDITSSVISNTQGIEYIVGTQTASTNAWKGVTTSSTLETGKIIAYYLPYAGNSSAATLNLTLAGGTTTGAIALRRQGGSTVTTHFAANNVIIMIYDGTYWKVSAYYYADSNTVPTGYCTTGAATAAKSATCTYGYRSNATYFPCLFRYANTASNATLAISSYATTALPIYVNGARTTSTNTFGAGVTMFLYYNSAYYCYNDGRFPIVYNGAVTSVQDVLDSLAPKLFDVTTPSFSSLPQTFYSSYLTSSCRVIGSAIHLSAPTAGDIDWTVAFAEGSLTINGTFNGSTATTAEMSVWIPTQTITLTTS